jgi:diacylglycerol kinase (ATP)
MGRVAAQRIFVALNPGAGGYSPAEVRNALERHFPSAVEHEILLEIYETCPEDRLSERVRDAVARGAVLVVVGGGDGTISAAADGLVGTRTPLGILPLGTANVLARELEIPVDLEAACRLLAGPNSVAIIDAMRVDGRCYFTHVGVGIDAMMIRDTRPEHKRRFGRIAYLWTAFTRLIGFQPRRFRLTTDEKTSHPRASQVLVANIGTLGQPPLRWGPDIRPDDGRLDVCIIRARNLWDYLCLLWYVLLSQHKRSPDVRYLVAERRVSIATKRPLPVQADGEIIGDTPVEVEVVPGAVRVIVPEGDLG